MLYTIKLGKDYIRYILDCDEHWFETTSAPTYIYTYEQAKAVVKQLKSHYVWMATIIGQDGSEEICDSYVLHKKEEQPKKKTIANAGARAAAMLKMFKK